MTFYTTVDTHTRLRFPRAADEPPRRLHLRGLLCSAFPAGVFALPSNQPLEATKQMKSTFTMTIKKSERISFSLKNLDSSFGSSLG